MYMFNSKSVPERVMDVVASELAEWSVGNVANVDAGTLEMVLRTARDALVQGGPKQEMVIPQEMAVTLDTFRDPALEAGIFRLARGFTGAWKQWVLMAPQQVTKYVLNNITSDLEAILTAQPGILKELKGGLEMLMDMGKTGQAQPLLKEAIERGVIHSALTMQEIQGMNQFKFDDSGRLVQAGLNLDILKAPKAYFNIVRRGILYRENTVRLAAYLYYRKQFVDKGKSIRDVGFAATKPWYAEGITDKKDLSARYARDVMGDYGNVSRGGRRMAEIGVPFWRWSESNIRRYVNRFRNAYYTYHDGKKQKGVALAALHAGALVGKMMTFQIAVMAWNRLIMGDEEDDLSERQRRKPHVTLMRLPGDTINLTEDLSQDTGKILVLNYMGALTDFGAWIGIEEALAIKHEVNMGRASGADIITALAKAPVNRFTQGINPLFTTPVQLALGREFYPDIFNPRAMRDPWHFTARSMSLGGIYPELIGLLGGTAASRSAVQRAVNILLNQIDPKESAYLEIQSKGYAYVQRVLKKPADFGVGGREGRLRYEFRRALRMGDEGAAYELREVLQQEYNLTPRKIRELVDAVEPLNMLNKKQRMAFLRTLSQNEMKKYYLARRFHKEMRNLAMSAKE